MASTGFAQSPSRVTTVTARPTILTDRSFRWATIPCIAPCRWSASVTFGLETLRNASRISSPA